MFKKLSIAIALGAITASPLLAQTETATASAPAAATNGASKFESDQARYSYFLGADMAKGMIAMQELYDLDTSSVTQAFTEIMSGTESKLSEEEMAATGAEFQQIFQEAAMKKFEADAAQLAEDNKTYLDENAKKEGVQTTESGLQYKVVAEGDGEKPSETDTVKVHYVGTLIDGSEFDSSVARGEPATFPLNQVIPGWTEGLQLMPVGSTYQFTIPSDLAYGPEGIPGGIPGGSTLNFEVELLEIVKPEITAETATATTSE